MNREQKRAYIKKAKKKGVPQKMAEAHAEIMDISDGKIIEPQDIQEGEKVRLNLENIKTRKNYDKMTDKYKLFVETNANTIFTAHLERPTLISFVEKPSWLFYSGDLIKLGEGESNVSHKDTV